MSRYRILESVLDDRIESVHTYEDLDIHHPTRNRRGMETGRLEDFEARRLHQSVNGEFEEIRALAGGRILVKKDFILTHDADGAVRIPSPVEGYVHYLQGDPNAALRIYDRPHHQSGAKLLAQVLHMDADSFQLVEGERVAYGQPLGTQSDTGTPGAIHAHVEAELDQFKQYIHDIDSGAITPDSYPALLSSPYNPHNFLYMQALAGVHQMESGRNIAPGPHSGNLAAALTVEAVRAGLVRVDRIELNDVGTLARAIQVSQVRDEPWLNAMTTPVGTEAASRQSLAWTSEQARQLDEATRVQQAEQPALVRSGGGMQR